MDTIGKKLDPKRKDGLWLPSAAAGAVCGRDHLPVVFIS